MCIASRYIAGDLIVVSFHFMILGRQKRKEPCALQDHLRIEEQKLYPTVGLSSSMDLPEERCYTGGHLPESKTEMKPQTPYDFTKSNLKTSQNTKKWSQEELKLLDESRAEHSPQEIKKWTDAGFTKEEAEEELRIIKQIMSGREPYDLLEIGIIVVAVLLAIVGAVLLAHAVYTYNLENPVSCRRDQVFQVRRAHSDSQPPQEETVNRAARQVSRIWKDRKSSTHPPDEQPRFRPGQVVRDGREHRSSESATGEQVSQLAQVASQMRDAEVQILRVYAMHRDNSSEAVPEQKPGRQEPP